MTDQLHVFERAGLGKAPFKFFKYTEETYQACHGAPIQPGGCCDYCGTGIIRTCWIKSADGKEFKVGADCVLRVGDAGLLKAFKNSPEVRAANKAKAVAKDKRVTDEIAAILANPSEALQNATVLGYVNGNRVPVPALPWIEKSLSWSGAVGRVRKLKLLKTLSKGQA